eukprot:EG_transcript_23195
MARFVCCLFVKQEAGTGQSEALRQRQAAMAEGKCPYPPLAVFAEGTTTNNRFMMPFRTGALRSPGCFHTMYLKWDNPCFSPTWEALPFALSFFGIMTQWSTGVEVHYLATHHLTEADTADAAALAQRLCDGLSRAMGVEVVPTTFKAKLEYLEWLRQKVGEASQKWD